MTSAQRQALNSLTDPVHKELGRTVVRLSNKLRRQRAKMAQVRTEQSELIRQGRVAGATIPGLARASGLTVSRIYQILQED